MKWSFPSPVIVNEHISGNSADNAYSNYGTE